MRQSRHELARADARAARERIFESFTARFNDLHVGLGTALPTEESPGFQLPLGVASVGDAYVVYSSAELPGNAPVRGDELIALDGVSPSEAVKRFEALIGAPNLLTKQHLLAARLTYRPAVFADGIQQDDPAVLRLRNEAGDGVTWS